MRGARDNAQRLDRGDFRTSGEPPVTLEIVREMPDGGAEELRFRLVRQIVDDPTAAESDE